MQQQNPNGLLGFISFIFWPVGVILGIVFVSKENNTDKETGKLCLIWAVVGMVVWPLLSIPLIQHAQERAEKRMERQQEQVQEVVEEQMEDVYDDY